ncbi:TBC1 domain family member 5 [Aphis gossypii]|uniref:TBC1 domain family member 5 n=1 Tax=Aphis gossypii TaxID=80765 RepID=UPI002159AA99|nr:TBC1 domain family member 5 [Aphis gossypii]
MFYTNVDENCSNDNISQNVSVKLYETEWRYLFNITNTNELRTTAIKAKLRTSRFRSLCWRLLLEILPPDSTKWLMAIEKYRSLYEQIKSTHDNDPHAQDSGPDDPLSQHEDSIWKQYFKDIELKKVIEQDVVRTSPGVEFFGTEKIRKIMIDILFCYSREHPDLCYRQGMHEILAPLLFVLHCDHQALLHVLEQSSSDVSDLIKKILDPAYLEADAYSLFNIIMEVMKDYYNINDFIVSAPKPTEHVKTTSSTSNSEVVQKLSKIRDTMLTKHDPELYGHLLDLDISFTTFGVRWLRLLFGGEFSSMDLLVLWDAIFATSPQDFALVNHIFVAMLVLIRIQLLKSDNTDCLKHLMRYPHVDVMTVIEYALHMFDPKMYKLPSIINSLKHDKSENIKSNVTDHQPERPSKLNTYLPRPTRNSADDLLELCRIKLLQYHSILNPVVPIQNKEARQALTGMLELCGMLNSRPGIIEMGKDVVRSTTTPIDTLLTPETPEGGPLLPPPASAITMKVFRKTENSSDSQIQGAPTKNPLKQMKRF